MIIKINKDDIENSNIDIFEEWNLNNYNIDPFRHCIIENFIKNDIYEKILNNFPEKPSNEFWKYNNPLEVKYALDNFSYMHNDIKNIFYALSHDNIINRFKKLFDIDNLEYDPYLHGGGLHMHPRYGRLNMHLDYEKHPYINKQRRLNIIYFINDVWEKNWKGDLQFWDENMNYCIKNIYPKKNTAVVFETIESSWHGVPDKILCPENIYRKTLAYYYISPLINKSNYNKLGVDDSGYRNKAVFLKRPNDIYDLKMEKLYSIRPHRRITDQDMKEIWPEWTINM